MEMNLQRK